jgi:integrase/recombinase XerD
MDESGASFETSKARRGFHNIKAEYAFRSLDRAVCSGQIDRRDATLIGGFVAELQSTRNIGIGRANKVTYTLVSWRRFIGPYSDNTISDIYSGIARLKAATIRGHLYRQNTLRDYIIILKRFCYWLIEEGYSILPKEKIRQIRAPPPDRMTKLPSQLLSADEVLTMIHSCRSSRDRALISCLFEGGFRIKELGTLTWSQILFDSYGCVVNVNVKTGRPRYVRLVSSAPYLAAWKSDYPLPTIVESLVFLTVQYRPLEHDGVATQLRKIAKRAGITKQESPSDVYLHSHGPDHRSLQYTPSC